MTKNDSVLIRRLSALDLNEYEARVYLALLGADGLTAYELGKRAGVPLSRCYEVARSLAAKGLALTRPGPAPRYRAVDPAVAVEAQRRQLDSLGAALARQARRDDREPLWTLEGRDLILATAAALIESAAEQVALSAPADALDDLAGALAAARARGVAVESEPDAALALIRDRAEALLGQLDPPERALATHLRQPAVAAWLADRAATRPVEPDAEADWIDWESRKVRRLLASVSALSQLDAT